MGMHAVRCARFLLLAAPLLWAAPAGAQLHDHLDCYKVKDTASFTATVTLRPPDFSPFELGSGCVVKVRSRQLCFPVEKDLITTSGPQLGYDGQELENAFLCYTVKCPASALPASLEMSDQFGTRTLTGFKRSQICAPAVQGVPPTTTTLPGPQPKSCVDATPPSCDGTCNDFNNACVADGGACICQYVDVFGECPMAGGDAPNCWGTCQGQMSCIDAGGGACQCAVVYE